LWEDDVEMMYECLSGTIGLGSDAVVKNLENLGEDGRVFAGGTDS
jgi:hypothetical protein